MVKLKMNDFASFFHPQNFIYRIRRIARLRKARKKPVSEKIENNEMNDKMVWLVKKQIELEKDSFEDTVAHLIMAWSVCVLSIVMLKGLGYVNLSDNVLIALASSPFISTCLAYFERRKRR